MDESARLSPEWSYLVVVDELSEDVTKYSISPDAEAAESLLKRLGVSALEGVEAKMEVRRHNRIVYVKGSVKGTVTQPCVVSLEPVVTEISDEFEAWFADPEQAVSIEKARREREMKKGKTELPMLDESEDPELIVNGTVDLGELATQYLSLSINPYVHAQGVDYEFGDDGLSTQPSDDRNNPFAALKDWKDKL